MTNHAPLFEETGDDSADQLVTKLTQACDYLMQENATLQAKLSAYQNDLDKSRETEAQTRQKIESLIQRLKIMEQEA